MHCASFYLSPFYCCLRCVERTQINPNLEFINVSYLIEKSNNCKTHDYYKVQRCQVDCRLYFCKAIPQQKIVIYVVFYYDDKMDFSYLRKINYF